jgi:hypothetical protein
MSEQNQNPLNMSLSDMDLSLPHLANGTYDLRIHKVELAQSKSNVPMLKLEHKTVDAAQSVKDESLPPGQTVFDNIMLAPSGKSDWGMVGRGVAGLIQSAQLDVSGYGADGLSQIQAAATWHKLLEGRTVRAKVNFVPEGPDKQGTVRRAKNEIGYYVKR